MRKLITRQLFKQILVYLPFILYFLYMAYTSLSTSMMYDDFKYSFRNGFNTVLPYTRVTNILYAIQSSLYDYLEFSARLGANILSYGILMFKDTLFKILNPLVFVFATYISSTIILGHKPSKYRDWSVVIPCIISYFLLSNLVIDEDVYWIVGAINYGWSLLFVNIFMLIYLDSFRHQLIFKHKLVIIFYGFLAFFVGSLPENISISTTIIVVFILAFRYLYQKCLKINVIEISSGLILVLTNLIVIFSPGARLRSQQITALENEGLSHNLKMAINAFQYLFIDSHFLIVLLFLSLIYLVRKHKKLFYTSLIVYSPLMVLNTLASFKFGYSQISLKYDFLLNPQFYFRALIAYEPYLTKLMIAFVIYCVIILLLTVINIIFIALKHQSLDYFVLAMLASFSILCLILAPGSSSRVAIYSQYMLGVLAIYGFYQFKDHLKIMKYVLTICIIFGVISFTNQHMYIFDNVQTGIKRSQIFNNIPDNQKEVIKLPPYRFSVHGNTLIDIFHDRMKKYFMLEHGFEIKP